MYTYCTVFEIIFVLSLAFNYALLTYACVFHTKATA